MRLTELHVDHFGILRDVTVPLGEDAAPFVMVGDNEAGKSTLLAFVRAMLFGIPKGRPKDERIYPMADRRIGTLRMSTVAHGALTLERRRGARGGSISIVDAEGNERSAEILRELLGGVDREIYRTIYGFSLDELQQLRTVTGEAVANAFHAASLGTDREALQNARSFLAKRQAELFKPNGRTQTAAVLMSEFDAVEKQLREHGDEVGHYEALCQKRSRCTAERNELQETAETLRRRLRTLENISAAWNDWVALRHCEIQLDELPALPDSFPEDAAARLNALSETLESLHADRRSAEDKHRQLEEQAQEVGTQKRLESVADRIRELERRTPFVRDARQELPALEQTVQREEAQMEELLKRLGEGWTPDRLDAVDRTVEARQQLASLQIRQDQQAQRRAEAERLGEETRNRCQENTRRIRQAERDLREGLASLSGETPSAEDDLERLVDEMGKVPGMFRQLEALEDRRRSQRNHAGLPVGRWAIPSMGTLAVILLAAAVLLVLNQHAAAALLCGVVAAACGTTAALAAWLSGADADAERESRQQLETDIRQRMGETVDRWTAGELDARVRRLEVALDQLRSLRRETELVQNRRQAAVDQERRNRQQREGLANEVREWMTSHGLGDELSPEVATAMLDIVDRAVQLRDRLREDQALLQRRWHLVRQFETELDDVKPLLSESRPDEPPETTVDRLVEAVRAERESRKRRAEILRQQREMIARIRDLDLRATDARKRRKQLFDNAGADSDDDLLRRAEIARRKAELRQEIAAHERALQAVYGPDNLPQAREILADADPGAVESRRAETADRLAEAEAGTKELDQTIGELSGEIRRMATDEQLSRLKARRAVLRSQLTETARQWIVYRTAEHLVDEARRRFEEEQQPEVVRNASDFLATFTQQRYIRVISRLEDEQSIAALKADGTRVLPHQLSRGTAEQLYLALRLGYIRTTRRGVEPLPVVMDDILVNFDPDRQAAAIRAIAEFAKHTQVLYLTCHPPTASRLCELAPGTRRCELRNGAVVPT